MDKEKQIKEMEKTLYGSFCKGFEDNRGCCFCESSCGDCKHCKEAHREKCEDYAEVLYEAGYGKISRAKEEAVKEFAEKLKEKLTNYVYENEDKYGKVCSGLIYVDVVGVVTKDNQTISKGIIDELLKEYGVENG